MKKHYLLTTALSIILFTSTTTNAQKTYSDNNDLLQDTHLKVSQVQFNIPEFNFDANTVIVNVNDDVFPVVDAGEGPIVLLIHGWPDSKEMWRYQIPFLIKSGYRVIAPDLRGFGDAPKTEDVEAYGLGSLMGDVITILDNMDIDNVNLVTHDWGAALGWTMARYAPERVNSFIPISIGAPGNPGFDLMEQRRKNWYLFMFAQTGMPEYELSTNDWSLFRDITFHPDEDNIIETLSNPDDLTAAMNVYRANYPHLLAGAPGQTYVPGNSFDIEYPLVSAPTLGLLGKYDFAMLEPQMTNSIDYVVEGNFEYKYFTDVGHWMMLEKPHRLNRIIKKFLDCNAKSNCSK